VAPPTAIALKRFKLQWVFYAFENGNIDKIRTICYHSTMNAYFDSFPQPTYEELTLLTAEEYLDSISMGESSEDAARQMGIQRTDLLNEINAQQALIDELVQEYNVSPDDGLAYAIEEAKLMLGNMLVDKGNLPPA
jgi:hypothetical protein